MSTDRKIEHTVWQRFALRSIFRVVKFPWKPISIRVRILILCAGIMALSLFGSLSSLYRMTEVIQLLETIHRVSVPMGQIFTQLQADSEVFQREFERNQGSSHWSDARWKPRPVPKWIGEILESEIRRVDELTKVSSRWIALENLKRWEDWVYQSLLDIKSIRESSNQLAQVLATPVGVHSSEDNRTALFLEVQSKLDSWMSHLKWGTAEYERLVRETFSLAESRVKQLKLGLQLILVALALFSITFVWFGQSALGPLAELTQLARHIARRGLKKEDRLLLPDVSLNRKDEVSQLAQEFRRMATALLEREKTVETQKRRLEEQNRLLRAMGELNECVLNSIRSVLIVTDLSGSITQCNLVAATWLGKDISELLGTDLSQWEKLRFLLKKCEHEFSNSHPESEQVRLGESVYGVQRMPLTKESEIYGEIIVIEDMSEENQLQDRLREAEKLAAVGRVAAQVAHEVRNPLHSIGLEAELAIEALQQHGGFETKQSLQAILNSVDRLEKITDNYLKWSRLSAGNKEQVDLGDVMESVLATYSVLCQSKGIRVEWERPVSEPILVWGEKDLLEQVIGNLFRNALQALERPIPVAGVSGQTIPFQDAPRVWCRVAAASGFVKFVIEDNGPGISPDIKEKLFVPFVTTKAEGTGLGLAFVKKVIEEHGGQIKCLSEEFQTQLRGAAFEFVIPYLEKEASLNG